MVVDFQKTKQRIKYAIALKGYSVIEFCTIHNISKNALYNCNKKDGMQLSTFCKFVTALGCSADELLVYKEGPCR